MEEAVITFNMLEACDLVVDTVYKGGETTRVVDDPFPRLLGVGNVGGFRFSGSSRNEYYNFVVLYSSLNDPNWPDHLDLSTGTFVYYGDNKSPGRKLGKQKPGNRLLQSTFDNLHSGKRQVIPPFLIFTKGPEKRDTIFRGLAAPGGPSAGMTDDLVAVWKSREGRRFENYRAIFTILDEPHIPRTWIEECKNGILLGTKCPESWRQWVETGHYNALRAERTIEHRLKSQQLPVDPRELKLIEAIYNYFRDNPYAFERFAANLVQMMDQHVESVDITRPWADGGRDAVGKYRLGVESDPIHVEFAVEAKCYTMNSAVGVRETSRLISRLRYRQFGVLVTTSYVHHQAYKEIRDDQHPVIILSAIDIVNILRRNGLGNLSDLRTYLNNFPR